MPLITSIHSTVIEVLETASGGIYTINKAKKAFRLSSVQSFLTTTQRWQDLQAEQDCLYIALKHCLVISVSIQGI